MKRVLIYAVGGLLSVLVLLLAWGLIEPYMLDVKTYDVSIPNLPAAWEGQQIGLVADWQIGMWLDNTSTVAQSVDRLIAARPAAALLAGDFVYGPSDDIEQDAREAAAFARPLVDAGIPTYAVLGNHDYGLNHPDEPVMEQRVQAVRTALAAQGVRVLENEAVPLPLPASVTPSSGTPDGTLLYLVGIGARWPNEDRPAEALAQLPDGAARIALMHNPNSFPAFPAGTAPIAVAGHTHGGQLRIPFTNSWSWLSIVEEDEVHVDGWIRDFGAADNHLYVNRGIGMSVLPLRINCPPEVTLFTLQRAP